MRIALLARRFDPEGGGTERDLVVTARCLRDRGHQVTVYADEIRGDGAGIAMRRIGTPPLGRAARVLCFATLAPRVARAAGSDLILSFARVIGADVMRSGGGAHIGYLRAAHQWRGRAAAAAMRVSPYHAAQAFVERRGFASPRLKITICVSELVGRSLANTFGLPADRIRVLYNGVDLQRFRPRVGNESVDQLRRELGLERGQRAVIFVGNGFARKGLGVLLRAWSSLAGAPILLVAGADRSAATYQRDARRFGIGDRVRFLGPRRDIERLFQACDALALPSMFEPFGNVALEAMAAGLPVLTTSACGVAEVLPDEMRRFVVQYPSSTEQIARSLNELLEAAPALGTIARATAERFTWDAYGDNLNRLLDSIAPSH